MVQQNIELNGFLNINKPRGVSSFYVVKKLRGIIGAYYREAGRPGKFKIGHMGTLDPDANGVLVIGVGAATRKFDEFLAGQKTYVSNFKFGILTDTLDSTGHILKTCNHAVAGAEIEKEIPLFIGKQLQVPPLYSAKSIGGERAYDLARRGESFELKPKEIEIINMQLLGAVTNEENCVLENEFTFKITCSSGTYIRAIARDLGQKLSTYGITTAIIRTDSGMFNITDALNFENINIEAIITNCRPL